MNNQSDDVAVIMVPFPCQSHLDQLLHLSCLISSYKIPVHYACSTIHVNQAKLRFNDSKNPEFARIIFHEFPTPLFESPRPNPNSLTKFPSHLMPSWESSLQFRQPLAEIFREISARVRRVIVIHDTTMSYAVQDADFIPNAELYNFCPISAFFFYYFLREYVNKLISGSEEFPEGLPSQEGSQAPEMQKFTDLQMEFIDLRRGTILNSCRAVEGTYIDLWANEGMNRNKPIWAIGPLNIGKEKVNEKSNVRHKCLEWLDKQAPKSVLYVAFGTTISMMEEEITELALGLEHSGQKFIWVLRDADKGNVVEGEDERVELPEGYEERVQDFGMIVRDWAPQLAILGHSSTGGFMSHCGWNSCLESITMGVPMATWPMHSDQPKNAFLITDVLKIGVVVNKWENRNEIVTSSKHSNVIKCLMSSKEGEEIRKRAEELGRAARVAVEEGGDSMTELNSFISHITN